MINKVARKLVFSRWHDFEGDFFFLDHGPCAHETSLVLSELGACWLWSKTTGQWSRRSLSSRPVVQKLSQNRYGAVPFF